MSPATSSQLYLNILFYYTLQRRKRKLLTFCGCQIQCIYFFYLKFFNQYSQEFQLLERHFKKIYMYVSVDVNLNICPLNILCTKIFTFLFSWTFNFIQP